MVLVLLQLPLKPWGSHCPILTEREVSYSFPLITATLSMQTKYIKTVTQKKMKSRPDYKLDMEIKCKSLSQVWLFATPWTIQSKELSRPENWSG